MSVPGIRGRKLRAYVEVRNGRVTFIKPLSSLGTRPKWDNLANSRWPVRVPALRQGSDELRMGKFLWLGIVHSIKGDL